MKQFMFSVRDIAVGTYDRPFTAPAIGLAVRAFGDEFNNEQSPMYKHGKDFDLFCIGEFNAEDGALLPLTPYIVARGADYFV